MRQTHDLISGNVNKVSYQPGEPDQFYHKYEYDADNRITNVYTSLDGLIWDNDASYKYYKHGPLARTEIGDLKVQGIDYAYTLQGWIKGVNANSLSSAKDMGKDGEPDSPNKDFAKDAFGYSLHYNANDYNAISGSESFLSAVASGTTAANLYNGNISKMATAISGMKNLTKAYKYDELNRLVASDTYEDGIETQKYNTSYEYDANGNIERLTRKGNVGAMDNLTYRYTKDGNGNILNNRLLHVNDAVAPTVYDDIDDQGAYVQNNPDTHNYAYDKIGNLIADKQEDIKEIVWNAAGKVTEIIREDKPNQTKPNLRFKYDAMGNRISKTEIYPTAIENVKAVTTYYVRDAQGNVMAVYNEKKYDNDKIDLSLAEQHLYGSSRLGMRQVNELLVEKDVEKEFDLAYSSRVLGEKNYELSNHLGNVLAVVSDKKLGNNEPDVLSTRDFYPFGSLMPGRSTNSESYRYGFGSHEKDDEVKGDGNHLSFGDYGYDTRLGRRWRLDPIDQISISNYAAFKNNPIIFIDPDGRLAMESYTDEQLKGMDLNRDDYNRFKNIVDNISNLVKNNETALKEICATTGFDKETVLKDLAKGGRVKVSIQDDKDKLRPGTAQGSRDGGIEFTPEIIKYLGSISYDNQERLSRNILTVAITVLHEYGHYGDQVTNDGKNSGQFNPVDRDAKGIEYALRVNYYNNKANSIMKGAPQQRDVTLTGHRGSDIEQYGFGFTLSGDSGEGPMSGRISFSSGDEDKFKALQSNVLKILGITK